MREIKFRFFINKTKEMRYPDDSWYVTSNGQLVIVDDFGSHLPDPFEGGTVLMQYTGVKDKSDKEIYEGDIIQTWNSNIGEVIFDQSAFKIIGKYNPNSFGKGKFKLYMVASSDFTKYPWRDTRNIILGNIYENPELLSKEEDNG